MGTVNFLRLQLELKVRQLKTDDRVIQREGLDNLNVQELQVRDIISLMLDQGTEYELFPQYK